jgi:hypothetical protein
VAQRDPIDLNTLAPQDTALYLESACSINDKGEIIGFAALKSNPSESHAYLAIPVRDPDDRTELRNSKAPAEEHQRLPNQASAAGLALSSSGPCKLD